MEPIRTERLLLRRVREDPDVDALFVRRNDPEVARYQGWSVPYPREKVEEIIADGVTQTEPAIDQWFMLTIADRDDSVVYGDLTFKLIDFGKTIEVGYTLASQHWGNAYAAEALIGALPWFFDDLDVNRVTAMIHPDNHPSLMVVERAGFLYEGQRADSYWMGPDEVADDVIYGLTRAQWTEWIERPTSRVDAIELVEPDEHNQRDLMRLQVHHSQNRMVAPVTVSFAQALLPETIDGAPVVPWIRGVRAGGQWVGFVMVAEPTEHHPVPYLWRLLIDRAHQGRGIGTLILDALIEQCRAWGCDTLEVTWEEGIGSPRRFYEQYGFVPTGNVIDGETEGRIAFGRS